jgi:hypothetical protein
LRKGASIVDGSKDGTDEGTDTGADDGTSAFAAERGSEYHVAPIGLAWT